MPYFVLVCHFFWHCLRAFFEHRFWGPSQNLNFKYSKTSYRILWNLLQCSKLQVTHSELKCPISFGNWFWHLIVANRSIMLDFYQKRPVFTLKIHPRPQRPKRPMKASKGQQSPKLQNSLISSIFNVKSSIVSVKLKKRCFKEIGNFLFHYIYFLKSHFVEYVKFAKRC